MLINCPECALQVSDKALSCPHCGYPMKTTSNMKSLKQTNKRRRLPNGFGQISEIKNRNLRNPFRAMVTIGVNDNGHPISKPLKPKSYFPTYNDAYLALVEYNKNPYDLGPSITVKELYEKWSEEHFKLFTAESSRRSMEGAWDYCSSVYSMRVSDLRARHIKNCMEYGTIAYRGKQKKATAAVQGKIKSLFNLMLDYALEYEIVDRNYARSFKLSSETVKQIQTTQHDHMAFTDEEMETLWNHVDDTKYVDLMLIQCYSGWRPQEIGLIKLEDVNMSDWTFKGGMKTDAGTDRLVPIHTRIQPLIAKRYEEAVKLGSKYLFNCTNTSTRKQNMTLTYDRYKAQFNSIVNMLHLNPEHRPHDGRKHFITSAKKYGVDEYAIKYVVGHKISDITEKVYTEREFNWLRQEIEKIR